MLITRHAEAEAVLTDPRYVPPPVAQDGAEVTIGLVAVNRDPDVFPGPERFDPHHAHSPHLTFGHGVRPCPGPAHAPALAAGVLEGLLP